ncbi:helix-turn-helix domain-containing protein [Sediminibacillus dalangtanensis]|uniref:Helix-turn-helix domain-containing protein n=1 Tax=Sediminibacillus dalangtanensis TaxID=2729421 RepID=A0ABX7VV47_9BACI|nr:helix-turn-helix domain-containing protein [Sediminibacillus dalangtanensis]QTN00562.1 helix-turn-helix domain-containing protein [Sediminibacillus dalangtanensis]
MRVLIIEDEPLTRRGLIKLLQTIRVEGFYLDSISEVAYAEDAIPSLQEEKFDIVFTDIEGGEMNGLELIAGYKELQQGTQWVIVSGYDSFTFAQKAILCGVKEYLLKPITKEKLSQTVERCLQGLKTKQQDFIGADEIDELLAGLAESIWSLNRLEAETVFREWSVRMETKQLSIDYYCNILTHVLEVLFHRIASKGSQLMNAFHWEIAAAGKKEAEQLFLEKCLEILLLLEQKRKGNEVDPIEMAKNYILQHLDEEISLEEVAGKLGLNASYFSQLFKKETGQTFVKYRSSLRMEKAKELLLKKDIKVIDIPFLIGLNDHPHFTKTFKKYTGQTPSGFRRNMGVD